MKKVAKRLVSGVVTAMLLLAMIVTAMAAPISIVNADTEMMLHTDEHEIMRDTLLEDIQLAQIANPDIIAEIMISAIDDSPFVAYFDRNTGRVSFYDVHGESVAYDRFVEGEQEFRDIVRENLEAVARIREGNFRSERVNRGVSIIDTQRRTLIEYDDYGNRTETYLSDDYAERFPESRVFASEEQNNIVSPFFNPIQVSMFVPFQSDPRNGNLIGGDHHWTSNTTGSVVFWTYDFPSSMQHMDVFFTNIFGTDTFTVLYVPRMAEVEFFIANRGARYGARVSTFSNRNGVSNVSLRLFTRNAPQDPFFAFYGALGWRYPLTSRHISSGYKLPNRSGHAAIDIVHPSGPGIIAGEAVFSAHSGFVEIAGWNNMAGNWVVIRSNVRDHPATNNWIVSRYMHLQNTPTVSRGNINQGIRIGNVGNTGESSGAHLHLDFNNRNLLDNMSNFSINPQRFFPNIAFTGATSRVMP